MNEAICLTTTLLVIRVMVGEEPVIDPNTRTAPKFTQFERPRY